MGLEQLFHNKKLSYQWDQETQTSCGFSMTTNCSQQVVTRKSIFLPNLMCIAKENPFFGHKRELTLKSWLYTYQHKTLISSWL